MIKSPNDIKQYQSLTLTNGIRVLLVHNPHSSKSAAALAVNTGHFDDPNHRQGLAHFLEHMLFLGTEKYPDGSEYQKFINAHGGNNNAWTATEHTCFFFDIHAQYFNEAVARFSQFFTAPLLSNEFVNKERKNIDAEFKLKLKDDIRRLYDVHKETINPKHPFAKFSVGSSETLADNKETNLREEVCQFFNQHYQAQYMTVVLEGPQSLDVLTTLAKDNFSAVQCNGQAKKPVTEALYHKQHQQKWINVIPVKNDRQLIISFAMPSIDKYYRQKPESILAYLLGHEGPGSILSFLKSRQWAMSLTAGSGINGSNFKDFNISISLSKLGEEQVNAVIDTVFSYIALLKSAPLETRYYQEKKALADLSFAYQEKSSPLDSVTQLVINMQHYPEQDYIYGDYVMEEPNQAVFDELLNFLSPDNVRIISIKQDANQQNLYNTSKWYQVPYLVNTISEKVIERWQNADLKAELHLPLENNYIVAKPDLYPQDPETIMTPPQLINQQDGLKVWFKQDTSFNTPKGYVYLAIDSPAIIQDAKSIAMSRLFIDLYSDSITEEFYDAELAGIHYHLYSHQGGMTIQISGISTKQGLLLPLLLSSLINATFSENKFALFKQQLIEHWRNAENSKSISQLFAKLSSTMQPKSPDSHTLIEALDAATYLDFCQFVPTIFKHIAVESLIHGNWQMEHGQQISRAITESFSQQLSNKNQVEIPRLDIQGRGEITIPLSLVEHDHAAVLYFPLPTKDLRMCALTMLTNQLLSPIFFQQMRTEKQYGYLVGVGFIPINRFPGIAFYIQSPNTDAAALTQAMKDFIAETKEYVSTLSSEDWQHIQSGLSGQLQEKDNNLRIKSQRYWAALCNKEACFNQKQKLITVIEQLRQEELIDFVETYFIDTERRDHLTLTTMNNNTQL